MASYRKNLSDAVLGNMERFVALVISPDHRLRIDLTAILSEEFTSHSALNMQDALESLRYFRERGELLRLIAVDLDVAESESNDMLSAIREYEQTNKIEWPRSARIIAFTNTEKKAMSAFFRGADAVHLLPIDRERLLKQIQALEVDVV